MPYISKDDRDKIEHVLEPLIDFIYDEKITAMPGSINYIITRICHAYIKGNGYFCYKGLNEVIGVLECCKLEYYRQIVAPYEDKKKEENGNISELDKNAL